MARVPARGAPEILLIVLTAAWLVVPLVLLERIRKSRRAGRLWLLLATVGGIGLLCGYLAIPRNGQRASSLAVAGAGVITVIGAWVTLGANVGPLTAAQPRQALRT